MSDSEERLYELLRSKAVLLVQREQEVSMVRYAQERTASWLEVLHGLSRDLPARHAEPVYARWTELMIRKLGFQAAAAYRFDETEHPLRLVVGESPTPMPSQLVLDADLSDYLWQRADGLGDHTDSALTALSNGVGMGHFIWHYFAVAGSIVLLLAGFFDKSAESDGEPPGLRPLRPPRPPHMPGLTSPSDLQYSRMVVNQLTLLVDNHHLIERLSKERTELRAVNDRYVRTNLQLVSAENYLQLVVASAQDGILSLDARGHCLLVNPSARRMLGQSVDSPPLMHVHTLVHGRSTHRPEDCPLPRPVTASSCIDEFARPDGTSFPVEYSSSVLLETGNPGGVVVVFRDITVRQELARMKDEFVSTVSHELRTPLTSIRGSLGLISAGLFGTLGPRGQRMLELAVTNTDRLVRLINDILDIEKLQAGRAVFELKAVAVTPLLQSVVEGLQGMADAYQVSLRIEAGSYQVLADPDRIVQVLTNLVGNAIKFSHQGGQVTVTAAPAPTSILFTVSDTGRGIPSDKLDIIFGRFQQADASDTRERGGTGLGLAIARAIVVQHGGDIWVESQLGVGSTFSFTLPTC